MRPRKHLVLYLAPDLRSKCRNLSNQIILRKKFSSHLYNQIWSNFHHLQVILIFDGDLCFLNAFNEDKFGLKYYWYRNQKLNEIPHMDRINIFNGKDVFYLETTKFLKLLKRRTAFGPRKHNLFYTSSVQRNMR